MRWNARGLETSILRFVLMIYKRCRQRNEGGSDISGQIDARVAMNLKDDHDPNH